MFSQRFHVKQCPNKGRKHNAGEYIIIWHQVINKFILMTSNYQFRQSLI